MAANPVVMSVTLLLLAAMLLVFLPRDVAADSSGILKYIGCFQKLADSRGACGKRQDEFSRLEQTVGLNRDTAEWNRKELCCKYSSYLDCYMKNVRHSCGDGAGKYAPKFLASTTQKHVRDVCEKFDSRKCSAAVAPSASGLAVFGVSAAVLVVSLIL